MALAEDRANAHLSSEKPELLLVTQFAADGEE